MAFLEMSRDESHGGTGWEFRRCIWSPETKKDGHQWRFWNKILDVRAGDTVVHLRGIGKRAAFLGSSIASSDGFKTEAKPPQPGQWAFASVFLRAELRDFSEFSPSILLNDVFSQQRHALEDYFDKRKSKRDANIFYVRQSGRLQCLNGAYLSDLDDELFVALFGKILSVDKSKKSATVRTAEQLAQVRERIGQSEFSDRIRDNYEHKCCFPGCNISDRRFLIASHIARWSDNEELRGHIGNGLCLCLLHDKAFEVGLFTLDEQHKVFVTKDVRIATSDLERAIAYAHGKGISMGEIPPLLQALTEHWKRTQCSPLGKS
jgi:hypothetical protein